MRRADRLAVARQETARHASTLKPVTSAWVALPQQPWDEVEADPGLVRMLDQILYRF